MSNKERFTAHNYVIRGEVDSKIVPGHKHSVEWGIGCPRCGTANKGELGHGQETTCYSCGLHMQRWGNALEVWE
jgi:hypothetical protein